MGEVTVQEPDDSSTLSLSGDCCIEGLTAHHDQLLRAFSGAAAVVLDLSAVSRIDTAGLQLLLAFVVDMRRQGRRVAVAAASAAVTQSASSAGLVELLGL